MYRSFIITINFQNLPTFREQEFIFSRPTNSLKIVANIFEIVISSHTFLKMEIRYIVMIYKKDFKDFGYRF